MKSTAITIVPDEMISESYCTHCGLCLKKCPAHCFSESTESDTTVYSFNKENCTRYHMDLIRQHRFPCGYCATFCPVGEDLAIYKGQNVVSEGGIKHCQTYGS